MTATYDIRLVALPFYCGHCLLYSTGPSWTGHSSSRRGACYVAGGAIAMGVGIWSMHFIAMLAYNLPIPMAHDFQPSSSQWQWQSLLPGSSVRSQPSENELPAVANWGVFMGLLLPPCTTYMAAM